VAPTEEARAFAIEAMRRHAEAKQHVAMAAAQEKRLEQAAFAEDGQATAREAVVAERLRAGDERTARLEAGAAVRSRTRARELGRLLAEHRDDVAKLGRHLDALRDEAVRARDELAALEARALRAAAEVHLYETADGLGTVRGAGWRDALLSRAEELEAQGEAHRELAGSAGDEAEVEALLRRLTGTREGGDA
jgi:phage shock protein A